VKKALLFIIFVVSIIVATILVANLDGAIASVVDIRTPRFQMNLQIPVPPTPYRVSQPTIPYGVPSYNTVPPRQYYPTYTRYQKPFEWYVPPRPRSFFYIGPDGNGGVYWNYPIR